MCDEASVRLLLAVVVFLIACGSRAETSAVAPSTSPTNSAAATASATQDRSPVPSATQTPRPNPTAGPGIYTSIPYAYRLEVPAGWRRSACQSTRDPKAPPGVDTFTNASVEAETGTDTGPAHDVVLVRIEDNAGGESAIGWLESGKMGVSTQSKFEKVTFDNNPDAARITTLDGATTLAIIVNARFRIYAVSAGVRDPTPATQASARALMTSLHILRDNELAEARATLATPPPAPVRSAEDVADALARGFGQKDTSVLAGVATDCLDTGSENAGVSFRATSVALAAMQKAFANGLVVRVQPRPIEFAPGSSASGSTVRAVWTEAGQPSRNVRLMLQKIGETWYWQGVLYLLN